MERSIFGEVNENFEDEELGHPKILKYSEKHSLDLCVNFDVDDSEMNHNHCKMSNPGENGPVPAVVIRNAYKAYKSKRGGTTHILKDFNMTVQQGSIYSLLGSSGCGKTTLLSCCVALKELDKGEIEIYGCQPGSRGSAVPGRNVGYMPQEIALYNELSIKEVLQYFGRMFGMNFSDVNKSMDFLVNFLALPPPHRRIGSLSGGQKRRVSFAVALVHSPKLLILDEPTVGVDPLLRQSIWDYLVKLVSSGKTTVIITTHYIEEARQSTQIGLMRNGRLLAEDSPEALLKLYNTNLLEDIVLRLCLQDNSSEDGRSISSQSTIEVAPTALINGNNDMTNPHTKTGPYKNLNLTLNRTDLITAGCDVDKSQIKVQVQEDELRKNSIEEIKKNSCDLRQASLQRNLALIRKHSTQMEEHFKEKNAVVQSIERISAMTLKNTVELLRNIPFLIFIFFMPAIQVIIVCIAIGPDPKGLAFGLVNHDVQNASDCPSNPGCLTDDLFNGSVSCRFLDILNSHGTLKLMIHDTEEAAAADVERSRSWGYLLFNENYTESMKERALFGLHADPEAYYGSRIKFRLDQSNLQIYRETAKVFFEAFSQFTKSISKDCKVDPIYSELPIYFADPIFGKSSINFTDFLAPSILLAVLLFFPLCGSGIAYITERKSGTLARSMVAGMKNFEIMGAYLIVQLVLLIVQTGLSFIILNLVFKIEVAGSIIWALLLSILVGVCGMSLGFLVASVCEEEIQAVLIALGTFIPNMLLSGLLWPTEGMPLYLQYFSYVLPCTLTAEAMRSVLTRGVGITHPAVWPGFISIISWIVIYWTLNILIHRFRSKK